MKHTVDQETIEQLNESGSTWIVGEGKLVLWSANGKEYIPLADLVVPAEPCARCDGDGFIDAQSDYEVSGDCLECHDGKPRLDLMVACPECDKLMPLCGTQGMPTNPDCDNGLVHAATVTAVGKVVPIAEDNLSALLSRGPCVGRADNGDWYRFIPNEVPCRITLPANARPGMFALQVEKVPE